MCRYHELMLAAGECPAVIVDQHTGRECSESESEYESEKEKH